MPRTIAIGDIHGCAAALATLIDVIAPTADDTVITLGDYIDRGPDSRAVIDQLLALRQRCQLVALAGNHEVVLLNLRTNVELFDFWLKGCGGAATLASYGGRFEQIPREHWDFFTALQPYHETDTHLFLHANYLPDLPLSEQPEEILFWKHLNQLPAPHRSGKTAVVGHTPQMSGEILSAGHLVCIDTWCFGRGALSAYEVNSGDLWQAEQGGVLLRKP